MALKDVKSRIASVKNIQKITRAMEMVAAARLRRAEQRIEALRPYAGAIRRMTRQAAEAAGNVPSLPILNEHESGRRNHRLLIWSLICFEWWNRLFVDGEPALRHGDWHAASSRPAVTRSTG